MGAHTSKEELLYQEVVRGNRDAVKAYRRDGASLEWVDKEGRTPLILACTRRDLLDMAITLLNLGANVDAYRRGNHGGFPLHHAAKKGLEKTVALLLSRGADPFAINDDGHTPLDLARSRTHVSVARLLEERVSLFTGMLREISGPGILEAVLPHLCTRKIWAVVIPIDSPGRKAPKYELAIYTSPKVAQPRTVIKLSNVQLGEPKLTSADPIFYIVDKATKTKFKFLSEKEGDKAQIEMFYKACKGIPQFQCGPIPAKSAVLALPSPVYMHGNACQIHPVSPKQIDGRSPVRNHLFHHGLPALSVSTPYKSTVSDTVTMPDDMELALALDASIHSAAEQGIPVLPTSHDNLTDHMWQDDIGGKWTLAESNRRQIYESSGAGTNVSGSSYSFMDAQQTGRQNLPVFDPQLTSNQISSIFDYGSNLTNPAPIALPSAPPLPQVSFSDNNHTNYSFRTTSLEIGSSINSEKTETEKMNGTCVVCLDAPAEGVCIPCGHIASCMSCLSEISKKNFGCPVCRAPIQQTIKVYAV